MARIHVCSLPRVAEVAHSSGARHLVSLLREHVEVERPPAIAPEHHLRLAFNDITEAREGLRLVQQADVERLIAFVTRWERAAPLLIHCFAGVSRSTASAYVAACVLRPDIGEAQWARALRLASPTATPNARLVALADDLLGRQGRMSAAIAAIGRGAECHSGEPFFLDLSTDGA